MSIENKLKVSYSDIKKSDIVSDCIKQNVIYSQWLYKAKSDIQSVIV